VYVLCDDKKLPYYKYLVFKMSATVSAMGFGLKSNKTAIKQLENAIPVKGFVFECYFLE
jgi:hypothetical protein